MNKKRPILINNKKYTIITDDYITHDYYNFEIDMIELFKNFININSVILDIGANIGLTSILFSELGKFVYSFEPVNETFTMLKNNLENTKKSNYKINNFALGSSNEILTINFNKSNKSNGFISNNNIIDYSQEMELNSQQIKVVKLDEFQIEHSKIDFIKLDVEGFEKNVILGGKNKILNDKPIIVLELNPFCLNVFQRISVPDFIDFVKTVFPIVYAVQDKTYLDLNKSNELSIVLHENIVKLKYFNIVCGFDKEQFTLFYQNYNNIPYYLNIKNKENLINKLRKLSLRRFIRKRFGI